MASGSGDSRWASVPVLALLLGSCVPPAAGPSAMVSSPPQPAPAEVRAAAYDELLGELDTFRVSGGVHTEEGFLLPETISIQIRSEVCVESREPGSRFWSLDYDTCFAYVAIDSLNEVGEYRVSVPCLDADRAYEAHHPFGDLRLVQRGPVSFLAESDAGWRHQETFTSSRNQRRDLLLTLDTDTFWVVTEGAPMLGLRDAAAPVITTYPFGTGMEVIRFHHGWAECLMDRHIGWVEMRHLGTEADMRRKAPIMGSPVPRPRRIPPGHPGSGP